MSTYREALSARPMEFVNYGSAMTDSASELLEQQAAYRANVTDLNGHWQDGANEAFNDDADVVGEHLQRVAGQVASAAEQIATAGLNLFTDVASLKSVDEAAHAQGFNVEPAPLVMLGPRHRFEIAIAGPLGGPTLQAAYEAQAAALTASMQSGLAMVNADDATGATALNAAAEALRPLDETGGSPTGDDLHHLAEDHSDTGSDPGEEDADQDSEPDEDEEGEEPTEPEEQQPTDPEDQGPTDQPTAPQAPQAPTDPGGFERPGLDEVDDPWADTEPYDPEDIGGGLASGTVPGTGGGIGAPGAGAGGLATGAGAGTGTGPSTGASPAAVPAAPTAGGTGKTGMGGPMMGAGGGRGTGRPEEESTRESKLLEDPEEDVWGVGDPEYDLYT
ncbi:hypothetical protein [Glycomyces salinus]|uniref:hypothetical protein n=1 Tax=Glycomyces salinus TaxID=980294 RepID=UPI0018EB1786|nr:hypothetical protein [Glycomyces salinus]